MYFFENKKILFYTFDLFLHVDWSTCWLFSVTFRITLVSNSKFQCLVNFRTRFSRKASCTKISLFDLPLPHSCYLGHTVYNKFIEHFRERSMKFTSRENTSEIHIYLGVTFFPQSSRGYVTSYVIFHIFLNPWWRTILDWIYSADRN